MEQTLDRLASLIRGADAVMVGVGSGLSSAAGYNHYHWQTALSDSLADFRDRYGYESPFAGIYYCYASPEEQWAYYARYTRALWEAPTGQPYLDLQAILRGKDCFVLTTNVDLQCERVFPEERVCAYQGRMGYLQCAQPCHDAVYQSYEQIVRMDEAAGDTLRVPRELLPRCPDCGRIMVPWVRDDTFLEGADWQAGVDRYQAFLRRHLIEQPNSRVLLLELGVGEMTPSIIKLPYWELTQRNPQVTYACLNRAASSAPAQMGERGLCLAGDLADTLSALRAKLETA